METKIPEHTKSTLPKTNWRKNVVRSYKYILEGVNENWLLDNPAQLLVVNVKWLTDETVYACNY